MTPKRPPLTHDGSPPRERTFAQEAAAFTLNEAMRDYKRLGYFPVSPKVTAALIEARRAGQMTREEMLAIYRHLAGRES